MILEDDNTNEDVSVRNIGDMFNKSVSVTEDIDEFKAAGEELLKVRGLGTSFRRKVSRDIQKSFTGIDGTGTQQNLLQQAITGYAMFDLVQPTYNLEYLARIYEISPYN